MDLLILSFKKIPSILAIEIILSRGKKLSRVSLSQRYVRNFIVVVGKSVSDSKQKVGL